MAGPRVAALWALSLFTALRGGAAQGEALVTVRAGRLRGVVITPEWGGGAGFFGVPYAEPPTGNRRLAAPAPKSPWQGEWNATALPPQCPQASVDRSVRHSASKRLPAGEPPPASEDCLYLNIFVPPSSTKHGLLTDELLPVLVYFHGGGFYQGSATAFGNRLAASARAVVVAPQYRLSAFGFFAPESPAPNFGLQDQQLALEWVRDNAAAFGGDPRRVTISGVSAGAAAVAGHLVLPRSFGLYSAAAMESPGVHKGWMHNKRRSEDDWLPQDLLAEHSEQVAQRLGCAGRGDLPCLRSQPADLLIAAAEDWGLAPALPEPGIFPLEKIRRGEWNRVPLIVGGTSCESCGTAFDVLGPPDSPVTEAQFEAALEAQGFGEDSPVTVEHLRYWYAHHIASEGLWLAFARILSDSAHGCSSVLHGKAAASDENSGGHVWRYVFSHVQSGSPLPGPKHGSSEDWLFDLKEHATAEEQHLQVAMGRWWGALAAAGDPNTANQQPHWPQYVLKADRLAMILDTPPNVTMTPDTERPECEHWKPYLGWGAERATTAPPSRTSAAGRLGPLWPLAVLLAALLPAGSS